MATSSAIHGSDNENPKQVGRSKFQVLGRTFNYFLVSILVLFGLFSLSYWLFGYNAQFATHLTSTDLSVSFRVDYGHAQLSAYVELDGPPNNNLRGGPKYFDKWFDLRIFKGAGSHNHFGETYPALWIQAACPIWFLPILFLMYPAIWLAIGPLRGMRRQARGLCEKCAYDLRGNPSGLCPECGTQCQLIVRTGAHE